MLKSGISLLAMVVFISCGSPKQQTLSEEEIISLKLLGDSISTAAQSTLLQNVATAIQKGGTDYAVEFCNTNAMPLTDSIANQLKVHIQRLSDKNRNTANAIKTEMDNIAWQKIKLGEKDLIEQNENGDIYYYKPISLAMPTCIKCHGNKDDILESTQNIIRQKYPNDKAIGYKMGDLRGMWKIKIEGDTYK